MQLRGASEEQFRACSSLLDPVTHGLARNQSVGIAMLRQPQQGAQKRQVDASSDGDERQRQEEDCTAHKTRCPASGCRAPWRVAFRQLCIEREQESRGEVERVVRRTAVAMLDPESKRHHLHGQIGRWYEMKVLRL